MSTFGITASLQISCFLSRKRGQCWSSCGSWPFWRGTPCMSSIRSVPSSCTTGEQGSLTAAPHPRGKVGEGVVGVGTHTLSLENISAALCQVVTFKFHPVVYTHMPRAEFSPRNIMQATYLILCFLIAAQWPVGEGWPVRAPRMGPRLGPGFQSTHICFGKGNRGVRAETSAHISHAALVVWRRVSRLLEALGGGVSQNLE